MSDLQRIVAEMVADLRHQSEDLRGTPHPSPAGVVLSTLWPDLSRRSEVIRGGEQG